MNNNKIDYDNLESKNIEDTLMKTGLIIIIVILIIIAILITIAYKNRRKLLMAAGIAIGAATGNPLIGRTISSFGN